MKQKVDIRLVEDLIYGNLIPNLDDALFYKDSYLDGDSKFNKRVSEFFVPLYQNLEEPLRTEQLRKYFMKVCEFI
jgi:hypothetical protein